MSSELNRETVDETHDSHRRCMWIVAAESTFIVASAEYPFDQCRAALVEFLADSSHEWISQGLAPSIDPQHPFEVVAALGNEILDCARQLLLRRRSLCHIRLELLQRFPCIVRKRAGQKSFLRLEVIVDQTVRNSETLRNVCDTCSCEAAFDHDPARGFENLFPPLFDGLPLHHRKHSLDGVESNLAFQEFVTESTRFGRNAYLGTVSSSGTPYVSPVTVSWSDGTLLAFLASNEAKVKNLRTNPKICVHFGVGADTDWDSCVLWGEATVVDDTAGRQGLWDKMGYDCNIFEPGGPSAESHVFIAIKPRRGLILRNYGIKGRLSWRA